MRQALLPLAIAVLVVLAATALFTGADRSQGKEDVTTADAWSADAEVVSFDGTVLAITIYKPAGATADAPVPVILHSHGWSGSRTSNGGGIVGKLWEAGYGVVSIDTRGHGDSGGEAKVHHKDWEVRDHQAILDHIHDNLDWVQKEASGIPKDIIAGGAGYSYAGGIQLVTASHDRRLDVLAPEITWSDLPYALAPEGVAKSAWVDFLYASAKQSGTRIDPRIDGWYRRILVENTVPPEALEHFAGANAIPENIRADVLLIQGAPDVLFNLNQAIRLHHALERAHAGDIRLFTHLTGHVAPYAQPFGTSPERRAIFADEGPCGSTHDTILAWFDEKLRNGPASNIPEASWALDTGECRTSPRLDASLFPSSVATAVAIAPAGSTLTPLLDGPFAFAGIPILRADPDPAGVPTRLFASLVVAAPDGSLRVVDDQATPLRATPGEPIHIELAGIATQLDADEKLLLRLDGANEWYAHNGQRTPGAVVLRNLHVMLPVLHT